MSTQRGNASRSRPQKHKNRTVFKNNLHDTSHRTKFINGIKVNDVCQRCKEVIEWKIKYKKYKPLTQPRKCVKCEQRTVKKAYHVMCTDCGRKLQVCTKCCQSKEIVPNEPDQREQLKLDAEMQQLLQSLSERKRRTFLRYMAKKNKDVDDNLGEQRDDLIVKLNALKIDDTRDENSDFGFSESDEDDGEDEF